MNFRYICLASDTFRVTPGIYFYIQMSSQIKEKKNQWPPLNFHFAIIILHRRQNQTQAQSHMHTWKRKIQDDFRSLSDAHESSHEV